MRKLLPLLLLLCASFIAHAQTLVSAFPNQTQGNAVTSKATTAINCTGANFIVAVITSSASGVNYTSFADNVNGAWTSVAVDWFASGTDGVRIMYKENPSVSSSMTFTLTYSSTAYITIEGGCYSGMLTASVLDQTDSGTGAGTGTTLTSGTTATTSQAAELLITGGTISAGTDTTFTGASSFTVRSYTGHADLGGVGYMADRVVSATGAYAGVVTWGGSSSPWVAGIATFKAAGGGGGIAVPIFMHHLSQQSAQ